MSQRLGLSNSRVLGDEGRRKDDEIVVFGVCTRSYLDTYSLRNPMSREKRIISSRVTGRVSVLEYWLSYYWYSIGLVTFEKLDGKCCILIPGVEFPIQNI